MRKIYVWQNRKFSNFKIQKITLKNNKFIKEINLLILFKKRR